MTWAALSTRSTGELITAAIWNQDIVANLNALKLPNSAHYELTGTSDYTTASTSFANVDATDGKLSLSITLAVQADVLVHFHGSGVNSTGNIYFDVTRNGTRIAGDDGMVKYPSGSVQGFEFTRLVPSVPAGAQTFNLQWKVAAGTATLYSGTASGNTLHGQYWVREFN